MPDAEYCIPVILLNQGAHRGRRRQVSGGSGIDHILTSKQGVMKMGTRNFEENMEMVSNYLCFESNSHCCCCCSGASSHVDPSRSGSHE